MYVSTPVKSIPGTSTTFAISIGALLKFNLICKKCSTFCAEANSNYSVCIQHLLAHATNFSNTVLQTTINLYKHISLLENSTASISLSYNKNVHTAISQFWFHTHEMFLPCTVINQQLHYGMSDRRTTTKRSTAKTSRNEDQSDDCNTTPTKK